MVNAELQYSNLKKKENRGNKKGPQNHRNTHVYQGVASSGIVFSCKKGPQRDGKHYRGKDN